ncbi:MAG: hypothetical protein ABJL99_02990 [Aliishimia sp.]
MFIRKRAKPKHTKGKGTVTILVFLLLTSAGLRIATSADTAVAEVKSAMKSGNGGAIAPEISKDVPSNEELTQLLRAFEKREAEIKEKELQIEKRLMALSAADTQINERILELKTAESDLRNTLALASSAAEDDLARLTAVYENMKPKIASTLFEEMDPEFAAGFIGRLRPDTAASIMAGMNPQVAYTISSILAGRNANVPKK